MTLQEALTGAVEDLLFTRERFEGSSGAERRYWEAITI